MQPSLRTDVRVASLETADQYRLATGLYTDVFGYHGSDLGLNANLMSALRKNGGSSIGAFDASGTLIGFVYGFAGTDRSGAHFRQRDLQRRDADHRTARSVGCAGGRGTRWGCAQHRRAVLGQRRGKRCDQAALPHPLRDGPLIHHHQSARDSARRSALIPGDSP